MAAAKFAGGLQDYFLQIFRARVAVLLQQLEQASFTELFAIRKVRFRYTIGEKQYAVARCQVIGPSGILLYGKNAENAAAFQQPIVRAVAMRDDRRIVAGVGVTQAAGRAVQLRVKKGDKAIGGNIAANKRIQALAQFLRSKRRGREASKSRLQIGHQQRRRHALARNIADANAQRLGPKRKHVVIIAAHYARWLPSS